MTCDYIVKTVANPDKSAEMTALTQYNREGGGGGLI